MYLFYLPFSAPRGYLHALVFGPFPYLQGQMHSTFTLSLSLISTSIFTPPSLTLTLLPFLGKILLIIEGHPYNQCNLPTQGP